MSAFSAELRPWSLPGFTRAVRPADARLVRALELAWPLSDEGDTTRLVVVRNLTVLVRLLLWHSEIRGDGRLPAVVSQSMNGPFVRLRFKLPPYWRQLLDAREEWLRSRLPGPTVAQAAGGDAGGRRPFFARRGRGGVVGPASGRQTAADGGAQPSASQTSNRIPAVSSREEARLLELVDRLLDDYARRGANPTPSMAALGRRRDRQVAWDNLAVSDPRVLLRMYPSLDEPRSVDWVIVDEFDSSSDGMYLCLLLNEPC
jgi:hypothetical protein